MPRLCANLSMLFTEHQFLQRFAHAAKAGFRGVEFLFRTTSTAPRSRHVCSSTV